MRGDKVALVLVSRRPARCGPSGSIGLTRVASLLFVSIDRVHDPVGMTFAYVSARIRDVSGAINAIRAFESRRLAALESPMISQTALATEDAGAFGAGKLLAENPRVRLRLAHRRHGRCRCCQRRRIRLQNIVSRGGRYGGEHIVIQA